MHKLSLTNKMSLMVLLLVATVLSLMTLCILWYLEREFRATVSAQQFTMVSNIAQEIDGKIRSTGQQLSALAGSVTPEVLRTPRSAQRFLDSRPDTLALFDSGMLLLDAKGIMLACTPPEPPLIGRDFSFRDYYKQVVRTGKQVISEPFVSSRQHRSPSVIFVAPIFDGKGNLIGILGGANDLLKDNYLGKLAQARVGEKGYLYLFNKQRTIIVHPDRSRILSADVPVGANVLFDAAVSGFEGTGDTVNSRGQKMLSSFKRLDSTGWILAANFPQSEAYAPLERARYYLVTALVIALLCTSLVTWRFMRYLTSPLVAFIRHVEGITGQEHEPEPILIRTGDEIATLAEAFNRMVHEAHRQKASAQAQEAFSESLLQNSSVAIYVLDKDHRVIIWNRACEELTGVPASEVLGTDEAWKAFYDGKRPVLADLVINESTGEISSHYATWDSSELVPEGVCSEGWFPQLNGRERYLCFDAAPIRDAQGRVIAAIETLRDITERKKAEESLEKLSLAIEQMPVTVMITDREGNIEYLNPNFTTVTGYLAEEAVGKNPRLVNSDWHPQEMFQKLWETILSGKEWRGELRNRRKNGELYWESASISPVKGASGEITHFVAVKEDITERKQAQEALRRSDERIRLLLESTAEAIYGIDLTGACSFANPACARLLGYADPEELLGRNMHELVHHHRRDGSRYPQEECPLCRVLRGEAGVYVDDEVFWRADGSSFAVEYWSYPQLRDGEVVGGVVTFFDITTRKKAEEELRRATAAAEAATKAKSEFLANMSHEIRTPLNAALGMLYLLQQTGLSEQQKNYLDKAQTASSMLLKLINDILDFSKIEAGKLVLEQVPFRLSTVLGDISAVATSTLHGKPVRLKVAAAPGVPDLLVGDPLRLSQVLLNLTNNAVKFTDQGEVRVEVSPVTEDGVNCTLRFSVADTGIGMTPEQQGALFNAFTQADSSTTRRYGGTGLGLAISKQLVQLMGGYIWAASEQGKGSTFSFVVTLNSPSREEAEGAARGGVAVAGEAGPEQSFEGVRILLVEDNQLNQEVARELLERRGVQVDIAGDGAQALRKLTAGGRSYHAVLMDVHMPVMDGLEATRRIRLYPAFDRLPVIAMTASALTEDRRLCLDAGMNDQVNKPVDVKELFSTLARWVEAPEVPLAAPPRAETVCESAGSDGLPDRLPGLDLKRAMRTVSNAPLLRRLLSGFRRENDKLTEQLQEALRQGDLKLARRLVHTVKGVGGNLGASELWNASVDLEQAMQAGGDPALETQLRVFREKLEQVLESIASLEDERPGSPPPAGAPPISQVSQVSRVPENAGADQGRVALLARRLARLLETQNLQALGVWEELRPLVAGEGADSLEETLQRLDFKDAFRILGELMQELEMAR